MALIERPQLDFAPFGDPGGPPQRKFIGLPEIVGPTDLLQKLSCLCTPDLQPQNIRAKLAFVPNGLLEETEQELMPIIEVCPDSSSSRYEIRSGNIEYGGTAFSVTDIKEYLPPYAITFPNCLTRQDDGTLGFLAPNGQFYPFKKNEKLKTLAAIIIVKTKQADPSFRIYPAIVQDHWQAMFDIYGTLKSEAQMIEAATTTQVQTALSASETESPAITWDEIDGLVMGLPTVVPGQDKSIRENSRIGHLSDTNTDVMFITHQNTSVSVILFSIDETKTSNWQGETLTVDDILVSISPCGKYHLRFTLGKTDAGMVEIINVCLDHANTMKHARDRSYLRTIKGMEDIVPLHNHEIISALLRLIRPGTAGWQMTLAQQPLHEQRERYRDRGKFNGDGTHPSRRERDRQREFDRRERSGDGTKKTGSPGKERPHSADGSSHFRKPHRHHH
jgi:hypothetical protein